MDDLARGWALVWPHLHGHQLAVWIAILVAVWLPLMGLWTTRKRSQDRDDDMRPKRRASLPGPDRGFR